MRWQQVFAAGPFELSGPSALAHTHAGPAEEVVVERALSLSFVAEQPAAGG